MATPLPKAVARRRAATRSVVSAVVGVVAAFMLGESLRGGGSSSSAASSSAFVGAGRGLPARPVQVACAAGAELGLTEPPSDLELADKNKHYFPSVSRKRKPKYKIRGTLSYVHRELFQEAQRMRPHIEPLLQRQFSIKEITFALNRQGSKLRHLLFRPRCGLPVFTQYKVRRLMRLANVKPRLIQYKRPGHLPPQGPGAPYPPIMGDVFAEVPPLKPWTPPEGKKAAPAAVEDVDDEDEGEEEEAAPAADKKAPQNADDIDELFG